ncbi:MAG: queuine tRNA-ribosyltransferase family protein, partial [Muribaculaceae bacterium]|nr:queuine tRNA-ribosyltransferase family protein [Muribaculaceae bacterium]
IMNMRNKKWADDYTPLDPGGPTYVDEVYSKAYVRHLFIANELLAMQIASIHNLGFYLWLVGEARNHISAGDFAVWKKDMIERVTARI